jgi:TATA-box binding protein (TBP) (component of TFIID and TFIIIB)
MYKQHEFDQIINRFYLHGLTFPLLKPYTISTITVCSKINNIYLPLNELSSKIYELYRISPFIHCLKKKRSTDQYNNTTLSIKNKKHVTTKRGLLFSNSISFKLVIKDKKKQININIKLFKTGSIQYTGCKTQKHITGVLLFIKCLLWKCGYLQCLGTFHSKQLELEYTIQMINGSIRLCTKIDRRSFFLFLIQYSCIDKNKNKIYVLYDPETYHGINLKINNTSFFIFHTGNVIITGDNTLSTIYYNYNLFITIYTHYLTFLNTN